MSAPFIFPGPPPPARPAAAPMPIDPLGAQMRSGQNAAKRSFSTFDPTNLGSNKMQSIGSGNRARLLNHNAPLPSPSAGPLPGAAQTAVDSLAAHAEPGGPLKNARPTNEANTEQLTNTPIPFDRRVMVPPGKAATYLPSEHDLVIFKRTPTVKLTPAFSPQAAAAPTGMYQYNNIAAANTRQKNPVIMDPFIAFNPPGWNAVTTSWLHTLWQTDLAAYRALTPHQLWYGHTDFPKNTGFTLDGAVNLERQPAGPSTAEDDGYRSNMQLGRFSRGPPRANEKWLNVIGGGQASLLDMFESRGLQEGATLFLVITKSAKKTTEAYDKSHVISHKAAPLEIPADGSTSSFKVPSLDDFKKGGTGTDKALRAALVHNFCPLEMFAVCNPMGDSLDLSFQEYEDEWGCKHFDGLILRIGRVLFSPWRFTRAPALMSPEDPGFVPLVNGYEMLLREHLNAVLLDPCKDGAFGIL